MIGAMRTHLVLEAATRTPDGGGGVTETWSETARIWGEVRAIAGSEDVLADRVSGRTRQSVRIRFRNGITPGMRLRSGARVLEILSVQDPDGRKRELTLLTEERDL